MSCFRYTRSGRNRSTEINMAPLIDMVFILLIFFLVAASFTRESGIEVSRPKAATAQAVTKASLVVGLDTRGEIHVAGRRVDLRSVRARVAEFMASAPDGAVVILADEASLTGKVVELLDQCRLAGASNISVAARSPQ